MNIKKVVFSAIIVAALSGCAARQEVSQFSSNIPQNICIAKHEEVREGVLIALQDGFKKHGIETRVIEGTYTLKHGVYKPEVSTNEIEGCDAIAFYTANWRWDLAMYMAHADIWVTDPQINKKIAQATYTTGNGLDKFINARNKIIELVDSMLVNKI